jgi:hypothetical protein
MMVERRGIEKVVTMFKNGQVKVGMDQWLVLQICLLLLLLLLVVVGIDYRRNLVLNFLS